MSHSGCIRARKSISAADAANSTLVWSHRWADEYWESLRHHPCRLLNRILVDIGFLIVGTIGSEQDLLNDEHVALVGSSKSSVGRFGMFVLVRPSVVLKSTTENDIEEHYLTRGSNLGYPLLVDNS